MISTTSNQGFAFIQALIENAYQEYAGAATWHNPFRYFDVNANNSGPIRKQMTAIKEVEKVQCIADAITEYNRLLLVDKQNTGGRTFTEPDYVKIYIARTLIGLLLRSVKKLDVPDIVAIADMLAVSHVPGGWETTDILRWPARILVGHVEKLAKAGDQSNELEEAVKHLLDLVSSATSADKDRVKLLDRLWAISFNDVIQLIEFPEDDGFSRYANQALHAMDRNSQKAWSALLLLTQNVKGSKPGKQFIQKSLSHIEAIGRDNFLRTVTDWFEFLIQWKEEIKDLRIGNYVFHDYPERLGAVNTEMIRGLVWCCLHSTDSGLPQLMERLAIRAYTTVNGAAYAHHVTAAPVGSACLYVLFARPQAGGKQYLSDLRQEIKFSRACNLIDDYLAQYATTP